MLGSSVAITTAAVLKPSDVSWSKLGSQIGPDLDVYRDSGNLSPTIIALLCGLVIFIAVISDWIAFGLLGTFESIIPWIGIYLLGASLDAQMMNWQIAGLLAFSSALAVCSHHRWLTSNSQPLNLSTYIKAMMVSLVAVGVVVNVETLSRKLDINRDSRSGNATISSVSPLVDLRSRLLPRNNLEVMTVKANEPAYWRLLGLSDFDGKSWTGSGSYVDIDKRIQDVPDDVQTRTLNQEFRMSRLDTDWLPAAYRPVEILGLDAKQGSKLAAKFDQESESIFVGDAKQLNYAYTVRSELPMLTVEQLRGLDVADEPSLLSTPGISERAKQTVQSITSDSKSPYEKAIAIQDWLRTEFKYSTDIARGESTSELDEFLFNDKAGFCQQFSTAFAVLARSVGIPARVAVGFTPGEQDSSGIYHVFSNQAHAWPEVLFEKVGWVPFEPTPGRGSVQTQPYTGVAPNQQRISTTTSTIGNGQQDPSTPGTTDPTNITSTPNTLSTPTTISPSNNQPRNNDIDRSANSPNSKSDKKLSWSDWATITSFIILVAVGLLGIGFHLMKKRKGRPTLKSHRVQHEIKLDSWTKFDRKLLDPLLRRRQHETYIEHAHRLSIQDSTIKDALKRLAHSTTAANFAPDLGPDFAMHVTSELAVNSSFDQPSTMATDRDSNIEMLALKLNSPQTRVDG